MHFVVTQAKDNALREAVMMNHVETMDVLIRSGAYVNTRFGVRLQTNLRDIG